jgi:arginyl-tRNA synthetase
MFREQITKSLQKATGEKNIHLETPTNSTFGDYSTNVALKLKTSADEIVKKLEEDPALKKITSKIEGASGFINFFILEKVLLENLENASNITKIGKGRLL